MTTYKEMIYLCLDLLKLISDDSYYSEEHIAFLLGKYRGLLLKQNYKDVKKEIPESNFQTICLELEEVSENTELCVGGSYLKSTKQIPALMSVSSPRIFNEDYYQGEITYISRERMRYVGYNKWLQNIIYASLGPDNYLYFKSSNPQYLYLKQVQLTGIFEDPEKAAELSSCEGDENNATCDPWDTAFPLEEALIPQVIELVVKELSGTVYRPSDQANNANDDLSDIMTFIRRNMKSNLQKQIEE